MSDVRSQGDTLPCPSTEEQEHQRESFETREQHFQHYLFTHLYCQFHLFSVTLVVKVN